MKIETPILVALAAGVALVAGCWIAKHFFSDSARWKRRRRRSNAPIASKHNRPSVRLSVKVKPKKKR